MEVRALSLEPLSIRNSANAEYSNCTKLRILVIEACRSGGTGRRTGLKILRSFKIVPVRFRSSAPFLQIHRGVEQLAARRAHNPKVVGSSPTPATKLWPLGQAVKTPPFHGGNRGSIPLGVTKINKKARDIGLLLFYVLKKLCIHFIYCKN